MRSNRAHFASKKVQIDVRLDEVVLRALEREPEQRWQQASDVKTEMEAIGKTPASPAAYPIHKATILSTRLRHWAIVGLVFLITLIALIGHNWQYRDLPPPPAPWIALYAFLALNLGLVLWATMSSIRAWWQAEMSPERRVRGPALAMIVFASLGIALCLAGATDVLGNVAERVADVDHQNYQGAPTDGSAWTTGGDPSKTVVRGGSWQNAGLLHCRSAARDFLSVNHHDNTIGLRVVVEVDGKSRN